MKIAHLGWLAAMALPLPLAAADIENGEELHFEDCTGCHQEEVYTRQNRVVGSLERLGRQVRFCRDAVGAQWFDEDVDDVIAYLNATYYHFE